MKKSLPIIILIIITVEFMSCNSGVLESPIPEHSAGYCLTFDDNYVVQWGSIKTLLDSNKVNATFFITDVSRLNTQQLEIVHNLQESGNEIACHSLRHLNAVECLKYLSIQEYISVEIQPALDNFYSINIFPTAFAYPYGYTNDSLNTNLLKYFKILRTVADEQRYKQVDSVETIESVFDKFNQKKVVAGLGIDKSFGINLEMIKRAFVRAKKRNEIIIFYAHCPVDIAYSTTQIEKKYLRKLIKLAKSMDLKSYRFSELVQ
jgi:peptidoglycan/xylan/chitin deacetylase (PgdA/CDA1 family)